MDTKQRSSGAGATILIVDDTFEWRAQVREILETQTGLRVIGEACDGLEAIQRAAELNPDLVLLDIAMPRLNGLEAADQIRRTAPRSKIVFLTQERDAEIRLSALAAGALGYVLKTSALRELLPTITEALRNGYAAD
jgi:DNA-binding NarL/FixJ family response regulator